MIWVLFTVCHFVNIYQAIHFQCIHFYICNTLKVSIKMICFGNYEKDNYIGKSLRKDSSSNLNIFCLFSYTVTKSSPSTWGRGSTLYNYRHTICMPNFREFSKFQGILTVYAYNHSQCLLIGILGKKINLGVLMNRLWIQMRLVGYLFTAPQKHMKTKFFWPSQDKSILILFTLSHFPQQSIAEEHQV